VTRPLAESSNFCDAVQQIYVTTIWQHWLSARYTQDCHITMQTGESM